MLNTKIHNRFDIFRKDPKTGAERQIAFAENIILDRYFVPLPSTDGYGVSNYSIHVGTGSGTLDVTRTELFSELFRMGATGATYTYDAVNHVWSVRQSVTITEAQYNGSVITEIGVGGRAYLSSTNYYWLTTHAMLRDMNGNSVSITKTASDILTFYSTVYAIIPPSFDSGAIGLFPGLRTDIVNRLLGKNQWKTSHSTAFKKNISLMSSFGSDNNHFYVGGVSTTLSMDATRKIWTLTCARLGAADFNVAGGIYGMQDSAGIYFDFIHSTVFPGSTVTDEALGTGDGATTDFKTAFGHLTAGAVVKVNGVVDETVTVDLDKPYDNNLLRLMNVLDTNDTTVCPGAYNTSNSTATTQYVILENPYYATWGIDSVDGYRCKVYCSDDMVTWTFVRDGAGAVSSDYRGKRYWKLTGDGNVYYGFEGLLSNDLSTAYLKNVHFATTPAVGAELTISYTTRVLAKDANHVYDTTYQINVDRYTP